MKESFTQIRARAEKVRAEVTAIIRGLDDPIAARKLYTLLAEIIGGKAASPSWSLIEIQVRIGTIAYAAFVEDGKKLTKVLKQYLPQEEKPVPKKKATSSRSAKR